MKNKTKNRTVDDVMNDWAYWGRICPESDSDMQLLSDEIERLRERVKQYTEVTQDGFRVGPGDTIYSYDYLASGGIDEWTIGMGFGYEYDADPSEAYYTPEAVRRAEKEDKITPRE